MYPLLRPLLFKLNPESAHHLSFTALGAAKPLKSLFKHLFQYQDPRLERTFFGLKFPNPIGLAAGLDKEGELTEMWECLGFGHAEIGTFTAMAQPGNPKPRVKRLVSERALINSMGFPNSGAEAAALRLKNLKENGNWPKAPVGINIGKSKAAPLEEAEEDYLKSVSLLASLADFLVINVSSPNTPGLRKLQETKPLKKLLGAVVKGAKKKPVLLKLSPDMDEKGYRGAAETALSQGCKGLVVTNTTLSREGLPPGDYPSGGLSGLPLKNKALKVLKNLSRFTKGTGGAEPHQ